MKFVAKTLIYFKKSVKAFARYPNFSTIVTLIQFFPDWIIHLNQNRNSISDKIPWITFGATRFIRKIIKHSMIVFEYGSGGSTLFWASRVKKVISVEHDNAWYEKMKEELLAHRIENVDYLLIQEETDAQYFEKDYRNPHHYVSADPKYVGHNFRHYVSSIDNYNGQYFDIIVIDGRARPSCLLHAVHRLRKNGYIIIDNTERKYYMDSFQPDSNLWRRWEFFGPVPYSYDFSNTTVLKKL